MAIYAIADLHLPFGINKPMDVFGKAWENYTDKLFTNWNNIVKAGDTVVIPGDLSWATYLEQSYNDFEFINNLNGKKIISKGNHDYYYTTLSKMNKFFKDNNFSTIEILHNNYYMVENILICGTRGWDISGNSEEDKKLLAREAIRLEISITKALAAYPDLPVYAFLHYPPIYNHIKNKGTEIRGILEKYNVEKCFFGHLHANGINYAFLGEYNSVVYSLISADSLNFNPLPISEPNF